MLLLFGGKKIPELMKGLGRGGRNSKTRPTTTRRNKTFRKADGATSGALIGMCIRLVAPARATPTAEQVVITDTLASDTAASSAEESLPLELSSAELAPVTWMRTGAFFGHQSAEHPQFRRGRNPGTGHGGTPVRMDWLDSRSPLDLAWNPVVHSRIAFTPANAKSTSAPCSAALRATFEETSIATASLN